MSGAKESWRSARLGEIVLEIKNGLPAKPESAPPGLPILRISAVRPGRVSFDDVRYHRGDVHDAAQYYVKQGDLLFIRFNGNPYLTAACAMVRSPPQHCVYPDKLMRVRTSPEVAIPEFVELAFMLPETRAQLQEYIKTAAGQHGISGRDLREIVIPVPPVTEQRRIVARIEALFVRTRRARADLERIAPLAKRYAKASLGKAFAGELTAAWRRANSADRGAARGPQIQGPFDLPGNWRWRYLPSLGELARGKSRHRPRNDKSLYGGPYPFVQTGDVRASDGRLRTFSQTYSEAGLAQSRLWPRDTVCITIAANIAETAILDIEACFPDSVVGFRANQSECSPEYIEYFIRTAKEDLSAFAPATAQKNINLETLEQVLVPLAPLSEQAECVRLMGSSEKAANRAEKEAARALALLDRLEQAILTRAFRGELVPQDPAEAAAAPPPLRQVAPAPPPRRRGRPSRVS